MGDLIEGVRLSLGISERMCGTCRHWGKPGETGKVRSCLRYREDLWCVQEGFRSWEFRSPDAPATDGES